MAKSPPQPSKPSAADHDEALRYGYSDESWARTDARDRSLLRLIQPVRRANYRVNVAIGRLEAWLAERDDEARKMGGTFAMEPDFQRGHVWDDARKVAFIESWLRGTAPVLFRFNNPSIQSMADATCTPTTSCASMACSASRPSSSSPTMRLPCSTAA